MGRFNNATSDDDVNYNSTRVPLTSPLELLPQEIIVVTIYAFICAVGLVGHSLVLFAVFNDRTDNNQMAIVTNMYIASLSIADIVFLIGLPFIIATAVSRRWLFGSALCKVYFTLTCASTFAEAFTITAMSADRCIAVCCPMTSRRGRYRTPFYAGLVVSILWTVALTAVMPIAVYAQLISTPNGDSCTINFPNNEFNAMTIYSIYTLVLGFIIPVFLISLFYTILVTKLHGCKPSSPDVAATESAGSLRGGRRRQSGLATKWRSKRVTWLVSALVIVYLLCWLPYWVFQIHLITMTSEKQTALPLPGWKVFMFQLFTILSYANSSVNPFLYAFASGQFRQSFLSAFFGNRRALVSKTAAQYGSTVAAEPRFPTVTAGQSASPSLTAISCPSSRRFSGYRCISPVQSPYVANDVANESRTELGRSDRINQNDRKRSAVGNGPTTAGQSRVPVVIELHGLTYDEPVQL